jgi:hypothetical protein
MIARATSAAECYDAIELAREHLAQQGIREAEYVLVSADRDLLAPAWRLTFKLRRLLPSDAGRLLGAGRAVSGC